MDILKMWNMRLLESISYPSSQELIIEGSLSLQNNSTLTKEKKGKASKSKSFRSTKNASIKKESDPLRRADSLNKLHSYRTDINGSGGGGASQGGIRIGGLPPLPREANTKSWGGPEDLSDLGGGNLRNLSQDSFFGLVVDPPPLPPRLSNRIKNYNSDEEDPDYSYIKEDEIKGPKKEGSGLKKERSGLKKEGSGPKKEGSGQNRSNSSSVDDVLNELEQEIIRDNEKKKRAQTLNRVHSKPSSRGAQQLGPRVFPPQDGIDDVTRSLKLGPRVRPSYQKPDPQDYTDFVPSKRSNVQSTSSEPEKLAVGVFSHIRSVSEPDPHPYPHNVAAQHPPVFETSEADASPYGRHQSQPEDSAPSDYAMIGEDHPTPLLPPRSWRYTSTSSSHEGSGAGPNGNPLAGSATSSGSNLDAFGSEKGPTLSGESGSPVLDGRGLVKESSNRNSEVMSSLEEGLGMKGRIFNVGGTPPSPTKEPRIVSSSVPHSRHSQFHVTGPLRMSSIVTNTPQQNVPVTTPPPLPPRSPTKDKLSRRLSSSSSGRCPKCKNMKTSVGKTVSLGVSSGKWSSEEYRKSLPDLADKAVQENSLGGGAEGGQKLQHRPSHRNHGHCSKCSLESSSDGIRGNDSHQSLHSGSLQNFDYLQLVGEETKKAGPAPLGELDLLSSCLEMLNRNVPSSPGLSGETATMTSTVSNSSHTTSTSATNQFGPKVKSTPEDPLSIYEQAEREAALALAELSQPLQPIAQYLSQQPFTQSMNHSPITQSLSQQQQQSFTQSLNSSHSPGRNPSKPLLKHTSYSPESKKQYNGHSSMSKHKSLISISPHHPSLSLSPSSAGVVKGVDVSNTLHWSTAGIKTKAPAPPIPPRSVVSLSPNQNHQTRTPPGHPSNSPYGHAHHPQRSSSATGMHSTSGHMNRHPRGNHMEEQGQSSTVFIHHIKDRRGSGLAHLV